MHREGINIPSACHKGQQPLIGCAKRELKIIYFLLLLLLLFFPNRKGCCPCSYISPGTMRKSDLCSSLSKNVHVF